MLAALVALEFAEVVAPVPTGKPTPRMTSGLENDPKTGEDNILYPAGQGAQGQEGQVEHLVQIMFPKRRKSV
jgi:hypothetical protein